MTGMIFEWLGAAKYSQHSICLTNDPVIVSMFIIGDLTTAIAYFIIGGSLIYYRANTIRFSRVARGLYGAFIFLCGLSHMTEIATMFVGIYRLDVAVTTAMAVVSAVTAVVTWNETSRGKGFAQ